MPYTALKHLMLHRKLDGRDILALILLVIVVGTIVSQYLQYDHSQQALRSARQSRNILRRDRVLFERKICAAVNLNRKINDRDRETLIHSRQQTKQDAKLVTDPTLKALLRKSVAQTTHEIKIRPFLPPINCAKLVVNPGHVKVPSPVTTTG
jgi:hypothetical protein